MPHRDELRSALVFVAADVNAGRGAVHYWAAFDSGAFDGVGASLGELGEVLETDLGLRPWRPWAPFADWALQSSGAAVPYFRHAHLFQGSDAAPCEPLLDEELTYEKTRLADTLVARISGPRILLIRHAEFLAPAALFLAERCRESPTPGLVLVFCFEAPPRTFDSFERLDSLGYLSWLAEPPLLTPAVRGSLAPPSAQEKKQLLRWLCFDTLSVIAEDSVDRLEALGYAGGFEAGIELGEALLRKTSDVDALRVIWASLARLYKASGDTAPAARYLTLCWKLARDAGDIEGQAQIDYLVFENSYRALVVEDVYLGLEERLTRTLEQLGWTNHLAAVLGKNLWVQTVGRTQGWDAARALWVRASALAKTLGNQRRRAVLLQTQGSLLAIAGQVSRALAATRRGMTLARAFSAPLHAAKVENGLGYLYFCAGQYRRAWTHHSAVLRVLPNTRDHAEYVGTLVNLGRLYLFNDQAERALPLLTTAVRVMNGAGLVDLPFHSRSNTYALLGVCCVKTGQLPRAREFLKKLRTEELKSGWKSEHRLFLELLTAEAAGDARSSHQIFDDIVAVLTPRVADLRHLFVWILLERSRWRLKAGDRAGAEQAWKLVEGLLHPAPLSRDERRHLARLRTGKGPLPRLADVQWDSPLLLRFSKQEASLRGLRRAVQDYGFLQTWHQRLLPGLDEAELFRRAVTLIRTHFPVESVAVVAEETTLAPGSDALAVERVAREMLKPRPRYHLPLVAVFPLVHSGKIQARLLCLDSHPEPLFGQGDSRVLDLAADHLSVLLLSQRKTLDLEERGAHLARALEVVRDTQERLVKSENLAVLGNLAAGLAHELNTPLGAILSASRTVQSLLSGPLARPGRALSQRLTAALIRQTTFPPLDRQHKKALRQLLEGQGDGAVLADLWHEVGLSDEELMLSMSREPGIAEVLEELIPLAQGLRLGHVIEEAAQRAGAVVNSLRSYLHGSASEGRSVFALRPEFEAVLTVLGARRWQKLKIEWALDPGLLLSGRRLSLGQVWTNLVQNAVQAMEQKGVLTLSARTERGQTLIEVADNGPGIPEELQDQVLQPFFSTKKQTGGLGLGLDICRRIVEAHEGSLTFESRPGLTVFRVRLPSGGGSAGLPDQQA